MKFITNLFAPRWKHNNPQVRKQALLALDATRVETQTILLEVARNDPEVFIRRFAIKRLTDIDAVQALRQAAPRDEIYQEATMRLCTLLSAEGGAASVEEIKSRLDKLAEARILEYVVKHTRNPDLQKYVLDKIDNENVVVEVITGTEHDDVRQYALHKLSSAAALKRVVKSLKRKDKKCLVLAQEKLEQLNTALAQRNELTSEYKRVGNDFLELVELCKLSNEWSKYETRLRSLHEQWRGVGVQLNAQASLHEYEQAQRIDRAFSFFEEELKRSVSKKVWEVSPEVTNAGVIDKLQLINKQLADKVLQLTPTDSSQLLDCAGLDQFIADIKRQWQQYYSELMTGAGAALPFADLPQTKTEFESNLARLERLRSDLPVLQKYQAQLAELTAAAQALLASDRVLVKKDITQLEKRFAQLSLPSYLAVDNQLAESYKKALIDLQKRLAKQEEARLNTVSEFTAINKQLADAIAGGKTKAASQLINRGKKLLKQVDDTGKSSLEKGGQLGQFNQLAQQLAELQGWRQWSSTPVKEQQINEMLELAQELESNKDNLLYDFISAANAIKAARTAWKNLTTGEQAGDQELWQQFDAACNQAYAVCQQHFDKQAEQRTENLHKRELFCHDLEAYQQKVATQAPEDIDWKAMNKIIHAARQDWTHLGIVNRSDRAKINKRYNKVMHALEKLLRDQQQKNRDAKEMLIKRVQTLAKQLEEHTVNTDQALESVKQLQAEWKATGMAVKEAQLWKQFREQCDSVFQVRRAEQEATNQALEAEKQQREHLIDAVEAAGKLSGDALLQARSSVEKSKSEWQQLPRLKKDHTLERRYFRACQQFDNQLVQFHAQQLKAEKQKLQHNVALCYALEKVLYTCLQGTSDPGLLNDSVAEFQQRWSPVDSKLRVADQAVSGRFAQLKSYAEQCGSGGLDAIRSQVSANEDSYVKSKDLLCIQMELLAGVESPPESRQRRMEYQVAQLAEKMKQSVSQDIDVEVEQLLSQWHCSGFIDPVKSRPFEQRFYSALQSLDKDYQYKT
ncbi:DUF349 domain-containing protein [Kaarinaea lacus]